LLFLVLYRDLPLPCQSQNNRNAQFKEKIKEIAKNKKTFPVLCTGIIMVSLQMVLVGHLMIFFSNETNVGLVHAGQLLSTALLSGMAGRIVLAYISDKWWGGNRKYPLHLSIWASVLGVSACVGSLSLVGMAGLFWHRLVQFLSSGSSRARPASGRRVDGQLCAHTQPSGHHSGSGCFRVYRGYAILFRGLAAYGFVADR
jgi:Na+/melibiose symporter-like transporter